MSSGSMEATPWATGIWAILPGSWRPDDHRPRARRRLRRLRERSERQLQGRGHPPWQRHVELPPGPRLGDHQHRPRLPGRPRAGGRPREELRRKGTGRRRRRRRSRVPAGGCDQRGGDGAPGHALRLPGVHHPRPDGWPPGCGHGPGGSVAGLVWHARRLLRGAPRGEPARLAGPRVARVRLFQGSAPRPGGERGDLRLRGGRRAARDLGPRRGRRAPGHGPGGDGGHPRAL